MARRCGRLLAVLLVDGNDRWQFQTTENPNCTNHAFAAIAGQSISGPVFDTANHNAVIDGTVKLTNYPAVVWLLGEESTADHTFDANRAGPRHGLPQRRRQSVRFRLRNRLGPRSRQRTDHRRS